MHLLSVWLDKSYDLQMLQIHLHGCLDFIIVEQYSINISLQNATVNTAQKLHKGDISQYALTSSRYMY